MASHQITHQVVLAFMQFLCDNGCSHSNIANYLTGVRAFFVVHGCDTQPFRHEQISTVRFKRENPDLSLLDLKFHNMQGFGANMEISFMKYGSFMQKFAPFETFVKIM